MSEYWKKRQAQRMFEAMEDAEETAKQIAILYQQSSGYLNHQIEGIFTKYKVKYGLSENEARELLNDVLDINSFNSLFDELHKGVPTEEKKELLKILEAPAYRYRINRLEDIQNQIDMMMEQVYKQEKDISTSHYISTAYDGYYKSIYDIQKKTGFGFSFAQIDEKFISQLLNSNWSGENYSSRIWKNTSSLANALKEEMLVGVLTGKTEREMANELANKFGVGAYNARRLVRTESNYFYTEAEMQSYEECECEDYVFLATLDLRTSKVCQSLDMKRFKLKNKEMGVNCPPMHPWCRSTTIAGLDNKSLSKLKRRARDTRTGKTYTVPGNTSYSQWLADQQNKHGKDTVEAIQKKVKNRSSDKKQYERYKNVFGDEFIPDSFENFQDMKYNDVEEWNELKKKYSIINSYENNSYLKMPASKIYELDYHALNCKRNLLTGKIKNRPNIACMNLDGKYYFAHSSIQDVGDTAYKNFKGNQSQLITQSKNKIFKTIEINSVDRFVDSEAKLYEYAAKLVNDGKNHDVYILSELASCDSCIGVMDQFIERYPNVNVYMVSTKRERMDSMKGKVWNKRWKKKII